MSEGIWQAAQLAAAPSVGLAGVAGSSCRAGVSGSEDDEEREERERLGAMGQVGAEQTDVPKRRGGRCGERLDADVAVPTESLTCDQTLSS